MSSNATQLVAACLALVVLTFVIGARLLLSRMHEMRTKRIHPPAVATSVQMAARLENVQAADNFRNLFEVPVLFYALAAIALATSHTPGWLVAGASLPRAPHAGGHNTRVAANPLLHWRMPTVLPPGDPESDARVKAAFDDIRATRKTDFVNNLWRALAFDPALLERTWSEVKQLMVTPSALDPLTKEMVYIAVSVANACSYCVHSHTAAARAKGMTQAQHAELLALIALAAKTNHLANGLQVSVDPVFVQGA